MLVRFKTSAIVATGGIDGEVFALPGDEFDVPAREAIHFIEQGAAEFVQQQKLETATEPQQLETR